MTAEKIGHLADRKDDDRRFAFGDNWLDFARDLSADQIAEAETSLRTLLQRDNLAGASFVDVGSGSGLFSLAARRLGARVHSFDYDMEKVLDACAKHGVAMECNSYPERLDLREVYLRMCKERGVKVVISTDSHNTLHLPYIRYGVTMARRGWLEKANVINTLPVDQFLAALRPKPGAAEKKHPAAKARASR